MLSSATKPKTKVLIAYLCIPLAVYIFVVFIPLITAVVYSFFEWKGGPNKTFIGLANYIQLFQDAVFWQSFLRNLMLVAMCILGQIGLAFVFVLMIQSKHVRLKGMHRTFGFFPSTISAVCVGFIWKMIYDYNKGLLNWIISLFGGETIVWLNQTGLVMVLIAIPLIWQWIGYYMVIIMSGISAIDQEIFEVAELDGANAFQRAVYIVLPLLKNTILVCATLCIAGNMKAFDHIYVLTAGGPGNASMVMALYGYKVSFNQSNMGYGSCISIAIFVLSLAVIGGSQLFVKRLSREKEG